MATLSGITLVRISEERALKLSVVDVTSAAGFERGRGIPRAGGLQDARLGGYNRAVVCPTCHRSGSDCCGHFGAIKLAEPVLRLGDIPASVLLLRSVCSTCSRRKWSLSGEQGFVRVPRAVVNNTRGIARLRAVADACKGRLVCPWTPELCAARGRGERACGAPQPSYARNKATKLFIERSYRPRELAMFTDPEEAAAATARLMPAEMRSIFSHVPHAHLEDLGFRPRVSHPRDFVATVQLVSPPCTRPPVALMGGGRGGASKGDNDKTVALADVVKANDVVIAAKAALAAAGAADGQALEDFYVAAAQLQLAVSCLISADLKKSVKIPGAAPQGGAAAHVSDRKTAPRDVKAIITGKRGIFRGNMAGKRVDFSGRGVIGPSTCEDIWRLGVPSCVMRMLSFPQRVTALNRAELAARVRRGAELDDGALTVRVPSLLARAANGSGAGADRVYPLDVMSEEARADLAAALQIGWTVERHLRNGDAVLFNRQPSLHRLSMQAFLIYRVAGEQFKLPLLLCTSYNADYDGDEMNIHALQSDEAIAEALQLMCVPHHMVTPQTNSTKVGLVQDALVGVHMLTGRDVFLTAAEAMQLLMHVRYDPRAADYADAQWLGSAGDPPAPPSAACLANGWPRPAVLNGCRGGRAVGPLWSGKQLFSLLLPPSLTLTKTVRKPDAAARARTRAADAVGTPEAQFAAAWEDPLGSERGVVIRGGVLLCGQLCKETMGAVDGGIVHQIWRDVGPWAAAKFLSDAQRVAYAFLSTCGAAPSISVTDCTRAAAGAGAEVAVIVADAVSRAAAIVDPSNKLAPDVAEARAADIVKGVLGTAGAEVLRHLDPQCGIALVVRSGAKGNDVNAAQIAGVVGQQAPDGGGRIPFRTGPLGPRTLACFAPGDNGPAARGFVSACYKSGASPSEYFFMHVGGRVGIVATAVSTSESGYNSRRMMAPCASQGVGYDGSVRGSSNEVVQPHYGGDDYDGQRLERVVLTLVGEEEAARVLRAAWLGDAEGAAATVAGWRALRDRRLTEAALLGTDEVNSRFALPSNLTRLLTAAAAAQRARPATAAEEEEDEDDDAPLVSAEAAAATARAALRAILVEIGGAHVSLSGRAWTPPPPEVPLERLVEVTPTRWTAAASAAASAAGALPEEDDDPSATARGAAALQCTALALKGMRPSAIAAAVAAFVKQYRAALVSPGEAVGAVGASSIGEPTTQMTLNVFHYSGIASKVTTGMPRLKELINAANSGKTSNMTLVLAPHASGEEVRRALCHVSLKAVLASSGVAACAIADEEELALLGRAPRLRAAAAAATAAAARKRKPTAAAAVAAAVAAAAAKPKSLLRAPRISAAALARAPSFSALQAFLNARVAAVAGAAAARTQAAGPAAADDADAAAGAAPRLAAVAATFDVDKTAAVRRGLTVLDVASALRAIVGDALVVTSTQPWDAAWTVRLRACSLGGDAVDTAVAEAAHDALVAHASVCGVPPIAAGIPTTGASRVRKSADGRRHELAHGLACVTTDGSALGAALGRLGTRVDASSCTTTNVQEVAALLGVEAGLALLQSEMHRVMSSDAYLDPRHTALLAETMTRTGAVLPLNRHSMRKLGGSLLQRATFEEQMIVLDEGAQFAESDHLGGSTAMLMGQPVRLGTGAFDVLSLGAAEPPPAELQFVAPLHAEQRVVGVKARRDAARASRVEIPSAADEEAGARAKRARRSAPSDAPRDAARDAAQEQDAEMVIESCADEATESAANAAAAAAAAAAVDADALEMAPLEEDAEQVDARALRAALVAAAPRGSEAALRVRLVVPLRRRPAAALADGSIVMARTHHVEHEAGTTICAQDASAETVVRYAAPLAGIDGATAHWEFSPVAAPPLAVHATRVALRHEGLVLEEEGAALSLVCTWSAATLGAAEVEAARGGAAGGVWSIECTSAPASLEHIAKLVAVASEVLL